MLIYSEKDLVISRNKAMLNRHSKSLGNIMSVQNNDILFPQVKNIVLFDRIKSKITCNKYSIKLPKLQG